MNDSQSPNPPQDEIAPPRKMFSGIGCLTIFILCVVSFFLLVTGLGPTEPLIALAFGWVAFLIRTLPEITWNWDIMGLAVLCVVIILFLSHRLLVWLVSRVAAASGKSWQWHWKWTWCGLSAVFVFFLVGMSVGGMVHQIGWLMTSREPLYEVKGNAYRSIMDMKQLELASAIAASETNHNLAAFRKTYAETASWFRSYNGKMWPECYEVFFVVTTNEEVTDVLVFPRDPGRRKQVGGIFTGNSSGNSVSSEQISDLLRTNQASLVPF
jgi:hypothetical protein